MRLGAGLYDWSNELLNTHAIDFVSRENQYRVAVFGAGEEYYRSHFNRFNLHGKAQNGGA